MSHAYEKLNARFEKIDALRAAIGVLQDDAQRFMPPGSATDRARQFKALDEAASALAAAPEAGRWIDAVRADQDLLAPAQRARFEAIAQSHLFAVMPEAPAALGPYDSLKRLFEETKQLENVRPILAAYEEVTGTSTTAQIEALSGLIHQRFTAPAVAQWLDAAEKDRAQLAAEDQRNLTLMRKKWVHKNALPEHVATEIARIESEGNTLHKKFRDTGDWSKMRDWDQHAFDTLRLAGELKKGPLGVPTAYDALLDTFLPGVSGADVEREFAKLARALPGLIAEAREQQAWETPPLELKGPFPAAQQKELFQRVTAAMGVDFTRARLEVVEGCHPQTIGYVNDVRFTAGCDVNDPLGGLYAAIHEAGHTLYGQNAPQEWRYQPAGTGIGSDEDIMGMQWHESQSRIWEVVACHTPEFFRFLEKTMREVFQRPDDPALEASNLERLVNRAEPTFIRIMADELTYPAHIALRHGIEKAVIDGTMAVDEMPKAFNEGMKRLLGLDVPTNAQGVMQDVHWPVGYIGYFPAYTLGDGRAVQLYAAALKEHPEIPKEIEQGNFKTLHAWLKEKVHSKGALLTSDALDIAATGEKLNMDYYIDHLSRRYTGKAYAGPKNPGPGPANDLEAALKLRA